MPTLAWACDSPNVCPTYINISPTEPLMRTFLQRISSRKFLIALAVQVSAVATVFWPQHESALESAAVQIAGLATMLLAAMGYGVIEASIDKSAGEDR